MFSNDFDPFEILNKADAQNNINEVIAKISRKESPNYIRTASNFAILHLAHLSISWVNALGKINEWQNGKELKKIHIAQLNYLSKHPKDLCSVVEVNLAVCAVILYNSYAITQIGGNITDSLNMFWCSLKHLSLDKGFEESQKEIETRKQRNMWNILISPIVLLMNQKYIIGENKSQCDIILADIVEKGSLYKDVDSLCTEVHLRIS